MVLKVKAQDPGFKDNPGQHWVVESLPDRSAITGPDGLKDAIVKWEADPKIMSRMWVLDGINPETLFNSGLLVGLNGQVTINHMAMIPPRTRRWRIYRDGIVLLCFATGAGRGNQN